MRRSVGVKCRRECDFSNKQFADSSAATQLHRPVNPNFKRVSTTYYKDFGFEGKWSLREVSKFGKSLQECRQQEQKITHQTRHRPET